MHSSLTCYHWSCFCFCLWHCSEICHCSVTVIDIVIMKSSYPTWNEHPHLKSAVIVPSRPLPPKLVILSTSLLVAGHPDNLLERLLLLLLLLLLRHLGQQLPSSAALSLYRPHLSKKMAAPGSSRLVVVLRQAPPTSNRHGWPSLTRPRRTGTEDRRRLGTAPSCLRCVATGFQLSSPPPPLLQKDDESAIATLSNLRVNSNSVKGHVGHKCFNNLLDYSKHCPRD